MTNPLLQKEIDKIDWASFGEVSATCYCRCDAVYRSHTKTVVHGSGPLKDLAVVSQTPCPACGKNVNNCNRITNDPEKWECK